MIENSEAIRAINAEWSMSEDTVLDARYSWTQVESAPSYLEFTRSLAVVASNLCVLYATAVLEKTLLQMKTEGIFAANHSSLFSLMEASKEDLQWKNYERIDRIRRNRNLIAHERKRFSEDDCLKMILSIREELEGWSIIETDKRIKSLSVGL